MGAGHVLAVGANAARRARGRRPLRGRDSGPPAGVPERPRRQLGAAQRRMPRAPTGQFGLQTFLAHPSVPPDHGGASPAEELGMGIHGGLDETSLDAAPAAGARRPRGRVPQRARVAGRRRHVRFGGDRLVRLAVQRLRPIWAASAIRPAPRPSAASSFSKRPCAASARRSPKSPLRFRSAAELSSDGGIRRLHSQPDGDDARAQTPITAAGRPLPCTGTSAPRPRRRCHRGTAGTPSGSAGRQGVAEARRCPRRPPRRCR